MKNQIQSPVWNAWRHWSIEEKSRYISLDFLYSDNYSYMIKHITKCCLQLVIMFKFILYYKKQQGAAIFRMLAHNGQGSATLWTAGCKDHQNNHLIKGFSNSILIGNELFNCYLIIVAHFP